MPVMHFHLRWPDGQSTRCYSPSLVIKDYFRPGTVYPLPEFMRDVRTALGIASERVRAKFGHPCSLALGQLARIETLAEPWQGEPSAQVEVLHFEE